MTSLLRIRALRAQLLSGITCLLCLGSPESLGHLPAAYAREYIRAERITAPGPAQQHSAAKTALSADVAAHQKAIERLERYRGPYAIGLTEPLNALARHHRALGDLDTALALYERAIYVERVNGGLDSEPLIPLLEEQLATYREADNLEGVDRVQSHLYRILGPGDPPYESRDLQAAARYLAWQREATVLLDGKGTEGRMAQLLTENQRLLDSYEQQPEPDPQWHRRLLLSQLDNLYLLLSLDPVTGYATASAGGIATETARQRLSVWERAAVSRGADLIERYLQRWPDRELFERASLMLELGNWYQWNDKGRKANTAYTALWTLMEAAGETVKLDQWLGQPAELPTDRRFRGPRRDEQSPVTLQFDVSRSGQVRRVHVLKGTESAGYRIARMLRESHFRPAFSGGEPVETRGVVRDYVLLD